MIMSRYVILRHELSDNTGRELHWDLMLEAEGVLRTWALAEEPRQEATIEAVQLLDHRVAYLEYEGDLSGGRGRVSRWDAGDYAMREQDENCMVIDLQGTKFSCTITAVRQSGGKEWRVTIDKPR